MNSISSTITDFSVLPLDPFSMRLSSQSSAMAIVISVQFCRSPSNKENRTASSIAARFSAQSPSLLLLINGTEDCNPASDWCWFPISCASRNGKAVIICKQIPSLGYTATKDGYCNTALHIAVIHGYLDVIGEVLLHCPDCWEMITGARKNVLHLAVEHEQKEVLEFILGNSWVSELINKVDVCCNTPLHLYVTTKRLEGFNLVNFPLADRDVYNKKRLTPLAIISQGSEDVTPRQNSIRDELIHKGATPGLRYAPTGPKTLSIEQENIETYMIIATLLVTVAAGFTIPGGYDSSKGTKAWQFYKKKQHLLHLLFQIH